MSFLQSVKWKREYKTDRERFDQPYLYVLSDGRTLRLEQRRFDFAGFASTVWDSSIVLSKFLERQPELVSRRRCVDLSAGCGLVAVVMSTLRPEVVVATDTPENLPLLRRNCRANGGEEVSVVGHLWGAPLCDVLRRGFDVVAACDVMYDRSAVAPLVASLEALLAPDGIGLVCHGRNAHAEAGFRRLSHDRFCLQDVAWEEFDHVYRAEDVTCIVVRRRR